MSDVFIVIFSEWLFAKLVSCKAILVRTTFACLLKLVHL